MHGVPGGSLAQRESGAVRRVSRHQRLREQPRSLYEPSRLAMYGVCHRTLSAERDAGYVSAVHRRRPLRGPGNL